MMTYEEYEIENNRNNDSLDNKVIVEEEYEVVNENKTIPILLDNWEELDSSDEMITTLLSSAPESELCIPMQAVENPIEVFMNVFNKELLSKQICIIIKQLGTLYGQVVG